MTEKKQITSEDVALLDAYFGPVEIKPKVSSYRRPAVMLPVLEHLRRLGMEPTNAGFAATKLAIERIRLIKTV